MAWARRREVPRIVPALVGLILLLSIPLAIGYLRQAQVGARWHRMAAELSAQLATATAEHAALQARKQYVSTDAYVEEAARSRLRWARAGEVVVVVLNATPTPFSPISSLP